MTPLLLTPPAVELANVSMTTNNRTRLHPTNLTIPKGTITGIIGRNGSGKTTLLNLIAAETHPTTGTVLLNGADIHKLTITEQARYRAILSQDTTVSFPFTVRDIVSWGRTPWRRTPQAANDCAIITEALTSQDLLALADRPITQLSGGERKRVHIARVIAQQPSLLLLDEADSDLDLIGRQTIDTLTRTYTQNNDRTVLLVSHDINRLARVCTHFILLHHGEILAYDTPDNVLTEQLLTQAYDTPITITHHLDGTPTLHLPH